MWQLEQPKILYQPKIFWLTTKKHSKGHQKQFGQELKIFNHWINGED